MCDMIEIALVLFAGVFGVSPQYRGYRKGPPCWAKSKSPMNDKIVFMADA